MKQLKVGLGMDGITSAPLNTNFAARKAKQFLPFLNALIEAKEYADDLSVCAENFALGIQELGQFSIGSHDLRWMVCRGWVSCVQGNEQRGVIKVTPQTKVVISVGGLLAVEEFHDRAFASNEVVLFSKPNWDSQRHELSVSGCVVKRFRWPACNQERLLSVFQEEHWPARIDDPLPLVDGLDPKRRLGDTIKCLNRNQLSSLIRFRGDGTGEGVLWDMVKSQDNKSVAR